MAGQQPGQPGTGVPRHLWRHTIEWGALAGLGTWLAGLLPFPTFGLVLVAGALSATVAVIMLLSWGSERIGLYMGGWSATITGWLAYARVAGQHSWTALAALVVPASILIPAGAQIWHDHFLRLAAQEEAEARARDAARLRRWETTLERAGARGVKVVRVSENRAGMQIELTLSAGGSTLARLQSTEVTEAIAITRQLPSGAVQFMAGKHAGEAVLHLNERDILAADVPFPAFAPGTYSSITKPKNIALAQDGTEVGVQLTGVQMMIIGVTNSGKSNLIHVLIAQITHCTDAIVWLIDLKGGRVGAPWITPWARGECERPAVDWVATTRKEAEIMLRCYDQILQHRMDSLSGGSKIHPSPAQPQIVLIGDEIADAFGAATPRSEQGGSTSNFVLADIGTRVTRKGRSEAGTAVWGVQRATVSMTGGGDLKSQCKLRVALGTASESDAMSAIPDDPGAAKLLSRMAHPGACLVWKPGAKRPLPSKVYRLDPDMERTPEDMDKIMDLAREASAIRPGPEPDARDALGEDYAKRWDRSDLYWRLTGRTARDEPEDSGEHQGVAPVITMERERTNPAAKLGREATNKEFDQLISDLDDLASAADDTRKGWHPARLRMHSLLQDRPRLGMAAFEIRTLLEKEGFDFARETMHRWLAQDVKDGLIEKNGGHYRPRQQEAA